VDEVALRFGVADVGRALPRAPAGVAVELLHLPGQLSPALPPPHNRIENENSHGNLSARLGQPAGALAAPDHRHRLDRGLLLLRHAGQLPQAAEKVRRRGRGVFGELWAVHGGGFYHSQKFPTGPKGEPLSDDLHWSKWEAYTTWLSGMSLLAVMYWIGASSYLIDSKVMALACRGGRHLGRLPGRRLGGLRPAVPQHDGPRRLMAVLRCSPSWCSATGLHQVFSARGAYIHVGAMLGTMMAANVFFHIIPGQKRMVEQIRNGLPVDPDAGPDRQAALGAQHLLHAAGAVHHDQQPLPDDLLPSPMAGWCWWA
jgi:hypothetical protein